MLHGTEVDQVVLEVLIRKAREIRRELGTAVPVPGEAELVVQAVVETVLLREPAQAGQQRMSFGEPEQLRLGLEAPGVSRLHEQMDQGAQRFAISPDARRELLRRLLDLNLDLPSRGKEPAAEAAACVVSL